MHTKDRFFGQTIAEYIVTLPGELPVDAVGLWQIVAAGRQWFGLTGGDFVEFLRLGVDALLERGAKPVVGGLGTKYDWILQPQYGETKEQIRDAVIEEWLASGATDPDPGGLWFALPSELVGILS